MSEPAPPRPAALAAVAISLLLAIFALLAWPAVSRVPFYTKGEPREALVVQSLHGGGNVILPPRNGDELPSKPVLFHWLGALASILDAGVTERAVRMPSLVASLVTMAATASVAWMWSGPAAAVASCVVLATSFQWLASSVTARVDMLLAACISLALLGFARAHHRRRRIPWWCYGLVAAATLTKGPVGLILPATIVVVFLALRRDLRFLTRTDAGALALAAAAAGSWYVAAWVIGGDAFLAKQVLKENVYRVLDPDSVEAGHVRPFWYYVPLLAAGAAPWSLFVPGIAAACWPRRRELTRGPWLMPLVWAGVTFVLFSVAGSKRSVYLLPAYPALALLIAHVWTVLDDDAPAGRGRRISHTSISVAAALLAVVGVAAAALIAGHLAGMPVSRLLGALLSETDNANLPAALASIDDHRATVLAWSATMLALATLIVVCAYRGRSRAVLGCSAALVLSTAAMTSTTLLPALAERRSNRELMERVRSVVPDDAALFFFGSIDYGAVFYRGEPIPVLHGIEDVARDDRAWLLTLRDRVADLDSKLQKLAGDDATYSVEEVLGDRSLQSSLLLVRIVRRVRDERSGGN